MKRKEITKLLTDILIADRLNDRKYFAKEVTIDYGTVNTKRIDIMEFVPQSVIHVSGNQRTNNGKKRSVDCRNIKRTKDK